MSDFFDLDGPQRNDKGSPMLFPAAPIPGCKECAAGPHRHPYTRASYLSDYVSESANVGLHKWQIRYLTRGMANSPDLCLMAAGETYNTGLGQDPRAPENRASGARLDAIAERAMDRVGLNEKSDYGTAVHSFTEPGNPNPTPLQLIADVESWDEAIKGAEIVQTEVFTANDKVMSAGTFDHLILIYLPGIGLVVLDKKTGKIKHLENIIQLATYANADVYDWATDERSSMPAELNRDVGIVAHIEAGKGRTRLYKADLRYGWHMAQVAAEVRDARAARKDSMLEILPDETITRGGIQQVLLEIEVADNRDEMVALYRRFPRLFDTTPALTEAVKARLAQQEVKA